MEEHLSWVYAFCNVAEKQSIATGQAEALELEDFILYSLIALKSFYL